MRIDEPFAPGFGNPDNILAYSAGVFAGRLYFGTRNLQTGGEIYRTDGTSLECVMRGGFGDARNVDIFGLVEFNGMLYAGTYHHLGAQLWRSATGEQWECVADGGLGNPRNIDVYCLAAHDRKLYAGTCNLDCPEARIGTSWKPADGAELLCSSDGTHWRRLWKAADARVNFVRCLVPADGGLYAGTGKFANPATLLFLHDGMIDEYTLPEKHAVYSDISAILPEDDDAGVCLFCATAKPFTPFRLMQYKGGSWRQTVADGFGNPDNAAVMASTDDRATGTQYAVTRNLRTGCEVWGRHAAGGWRCLAIGGAGMADNEFCTAASCCYRDALWFATYNRDDRGTRCYRVPL